MPGGSLPPTTAAAGNATGVCRRVAGLSTGRETRQCMSEFILIANRFFPIFRLH
jgi:hypothetical protein